MSLRQIQKQKDKLKSEEQDLQAAQEELLRDAKSKPKPTFSAFQMMSDEDEDEEVEQAQQSDEESKVQSTSDPAKKKKKKRNKKKKPAADQSEANQQDKKVTQPKKEQSKKQADEDAYLDSIIKKTQEEKKGQGIPYMHSGEGSVLKMDRKYFNYKKELKSLFAKSAQAVGAMGLDEEEKEERKNRGAGGQMAEQYENASKKMKRRLKMIERMQEKSRIGQGRKYLLVQPDPNWPKVDKILTMEQVKIDRKTGQKVFSFVKTPDYAILQKEFESVQATNDIGQLINFLHRNFYHHESLVYFADFLRIQGKFSDSFHFLQRCMFAFESAWTFDYQPVPPEKAQDTSDFVPQVRLDLEKEQLNRVFCDALVKYIDILGRKGCSRTSLEYCKFLLSISPQNDPYGALLRIDFYALRAHEYQLYIDFVKRFPLELNYEDPTSSLMILPNVLLSVCLAKHSLLLESDPSRLPNTADLDASIQKLLTHEGNLNLLLDNPDPEVFLMSAALLYPLQVESLIRKVAQKQINAVTKKPYYQGYQGKSWNDILKHELFRGSSSSLTGEGDNELESDYPWVLSEEERGKLPEKKQREVAEETLGKLYQIYVSRSSSLFTPEPILLWLKEVLGYLLNKLDEGVIDRDIVIAKYTSLVNKPFCYLSRYRGLRTSDFTDDITTINANELLMGGGGNQQMEQQQMMMGGGAGGGGGDHENMVAQQQLQQMIDQLQQPRIPGGLIQERQMGAGGQAMNEQELIALQEALLAQMQGENEDIFIGDEEDDEYEDVEEGGQQQPGGGIMNYLGSLLFGGNQQQQQQQPPRDRPEEDKQE